MAEYRCCCSTEVVESMFSSDPRQKGFLPTKTAELAPPLTALLWRSQGQTPEMVDQNSEHWGSEPAWSTISQTEGKLSWITKKY